MGRQRSNRISVPNLYRQTKGGKTYWMYRDQRNIGKRGEWRSLKTNNRAVAEQRAAALNALIYQQLADQLTKELLSGEEPKTKRKIKRSKDSTPLMSTWLDVWLEDKKEAVDMGDMQPSTYSHKRYQVNAIRSRLGQLHLEQVTTPVVSEWLDEISKDGRRRWATALRSTLSDVFRLAMTKGIFPSTLPNPALVTKAPRVKTKRARLTLELFEKALEWSETNQPEYASRAFKLALVTAQARHEIAVAKFADVKVVEGVEYLHVRRKKTGALIRIPTDLTQEATGLSVYNVIKECRDHSLSRYIVHHTKTIGKAKRGSKVRETTLGQFFKAAIDAVTEAEGINWGNNTPPSFHEIRSLAERLYRDQGLDTQALLGHKHARMTDTYHDARGHDWITVKAN